MQIVTFRQSFQSKPLATIRATETNGDMVCLALLSDAIISVSNYYNIGKNLSVPQVAEIAKLTLKDYYWLTELQLTLFVQRIKLGKYPEVKILDSFDGSKWFEFLKLFDAELLKEKKKIEDEERQETYKKWSEEKAKNPPTPETLEQIKELQKTFRLNAFKEQEQRKEDEFRKLMNEWSESFKKKAGSLQGFVMVKGKNLDIHEYLEHRRKVYNKNN